MRDLSRLLRPRSIAVIGGGAWCDNVLSELARIGFAGPVWHVHPRKGFASVADLPEAPDAAFVGVNRDATVSVVAALAARGAGGAVCFASGFAEAERELADAGAAQAALLRAAGAMPILGPNCYGLLNYLDCVALWPDQHGGVPVARGVALVTQSSNIAINLTMQARGLPLAYVLTAGNQAQQGLAALGRALLEDPRVTALGLHVEGIGDVAALVELADTARHLCKPVVVLKVGGTDAARAATLSHTASLAGSAAGAQALLARLGFAHVHTLDGFLEALKIAHLHGPLASHKVASLSCSGGEAALMADLGARHGVVFPPLDAAQREALRAALGPRVALANPLDYHTYVWGDEAAMAAAFTAMMTPDHALGLLVLDVPRADRCDATAWEPAFRAVAQAQAASGVPMAILASLPENLPEALAVTLLARGILPLVGLPAALEAIAAMALGPGIGQGPVRSPAPPRAEVPSRLVSEPEAKARLAGVGVAVPRGAVMSKAAARAHPLTRPVAVKSVGVAHKSAHGGIVLGIADRADLGRAVDSMPGDAVFVEEMQAGALVELLVGVVNDPAHGLVLTMGRGGVETELHDDVTHALLPVTAEEVAAMLARLRLAPVLDGYRGRPSADLPAIVDAVLGVQALVLGDTAILELEINPLLSLPEGCVAVDALIREVQA